MKKFLIKALDIQPEEWGPVSLLLTISFFIGIFLVTYDVGASTLFLDTSKDPVTGIVRGWGQEYLSKAWILSGILGVIASFIFVNLQNRISFFNLVKTTLALIFIYVVCLSFALETTNSKYLTYISFASLGPLNALALLSFYGIVTRAFNLKNQKRLTGTVDQGQMFATTIAFFTVPLVQSFSFFNDIIHFLFISFGGVAVAFALLFVFIKKHATKELLQVRKTGEIQHASLGSIAQNKYVRLLSFLFMLSVVATYFVEYSFLSVSSATYPVASELANFLAIYGGVLTVFSVLLQIFIGDRIITTYGVRTALLILPLILIVFTILSSIVGTAFGYEHTLTETPILFFLFIALSKLFFQASQETFEEPILKNFFLPIDKNVRHDIQAKVEGMFKQSSVFIAGAVITALGLFQFFALIHYSYFLIFIFVGYGYVAIKLFEEYQNTLKSTLASQKGKDSLAVKNEYDVADILKAELNTSKEEQTLYTLKLMEKIQPVMLESSLPYFTDSMNPEIRKYVLERIKTLKLLSALPSVKRVSQSEESPLIRQLAMEALNNLNETEKIPLSVAKISQLIKSRNIADREHAAKILSRATDNELASLLLVAMRDIDLNVRMIAILSAGKCKNPELWPVLIEYLSSHVFGNAASAVLLECGEKIMPALEAAFHKSGQNAQTQLKIVQIYGRLGGKNAIELLWNKIDFPNKKIRTQVLLSLSNCGFQADSEKLIKIKQTLEIAIGNAAWNMAAITEVGQDEPFLPMREALQEEIKHDFEQIFLLLSFIYDAQSIRLVKENIDSGTVEGSLYGIELLDVFLEDDLQPLLFPLLEDISQAERNERLQNHFPREPLDSIEVLKHIINRDYNYLNRWTKACAIFSLSISPGYQVTDDLIANLFNPDPLLRETAAWVIHYLDKKIYNACTQRLNPSIKKNLDEIILSSAGQDELRMERIIKIKQVRAFAIVPGTIIADMEEAMEYAKFEKGQTIIAKGDNGNSPLFVIIKGKAGVYDGEKEISTINEKEIIGEKLILDSDINSFSVIASEQTFAYKIEKERFYELMSNNYELARGFIHFTSNKDKPFEEAEEVIT